MPNDIKQSLGDKYRSPPPLYFSSPPLPQTAEPTASAADAPPDLSGIETRLYANNIHAQLERERTKALNKVDGSPDLRSRLMGIRASERLSREHLC